MPLLRILVVLLALLLALGLTGPVLAQEAPEPAVVVADEAPPPEDDPWTFRFLVPTVLAMSGMALLVVIVAYGRRVKGRYRVAR